MAQSVQELQVATCDEAPTCCLDLLTYFHHDPSSPSRTRFSGKISIFVCKHPLWWCRWQHLGRHREVGVGVGVGVSVNYREQQPTE